MSRRVTIELRSDDGGWWWVVLVDGRPFKSAWSAGSRAEARREAQLVAEKARAA